MEEINIIPFPSAFKDSPFGESWDSEIIAVNSSSVKYTYSYISELIKNNRSRLCAHKNKTTLLSFMDDTQADKVGVSSFIVLNSDSDYTPVKLTNDVKKDTRFTAEDILEILGVKVGITFIENVLSDTQLKSLISVHLNWIFTGNKTEIDQYFNIFYNLARASVDVGRKKKLDEIDKLLIEFLLFFAKAIQLVYKIISDLLDLISKELRKLKIVDSNRWLPYNADGTINEKFDPVFTPKIEPSLEKTFHYFEERGKGLDEIITKIIGEYKNDKLGTKNLSFIEIIQYQYKEIKHFIIEIYAAIKKVLGGFMAALNHLNAYLIGIYNGLLEIAAGIIDLVSLLFDAEKQKQFAEGISKLIKEIEENGIYTLLEGLINAFIKKYTTAKSSYDVAKFIGEDIAELLVEILLAIFTGGASSITKLRKFITELVDILSDPKKTLKEINEEIRKKLKKEGRKDLDDIEAEDLARRADEIWENFTFEDLFKIPPKKKPCFIPGTLVQTTNGILPIENIRTGMEVQSFNFKNGIIEPKLVTNTYKNWAEKYIVIETKDGEEFGATGRHLIWVENLNKWMMANQLEVGYDLKSFTSKNPITISKLQIVEADIDTYCLEVEDNNNFFVGQKGILVHNESKVSIFESMDKILIDIYEIAGAKGPMYVGQTSQGIKIRFEQHLNDKKKANWIKKANAPISLIDGPKLMTPFEAHVIEMYEMNVRGGKKNNNSGLENKKNQITKEKFDRYKTLPHNPCSIYG